MKIEYFLQFYIDRYEEPSLYKLLIFRNSNFKTQRVQKNIVILKSE